MTLDAAGFALIGGLALAMTGLAVVVCRRGGRPEAWPAGVLFLAAPLENYRGDTGAFNLSVFRIALLVAVAAVALRALRSRTWPRQVPLPVLVYGGLIVLQLISIAAVTERTSLGLRFTSQYLAGVAAAIVVLRCLRPGDLRLIGRLFLVAAALPAAASAWRVLASGARDNSLPGLDLLPVDPTIEATRRTGSFLLDGVQRMQGTFSDPNHFGFFVGVVLLVTLGTLAARLAASDPDRLGTLTVGLAAATLAVLVVGSYSRSAWLLCGLGVLGAGALAGREAITRLADRRALALGGALALVAAAALAPTVADRLDPGGSGNRISNETHFETMELAVDLTVEAPLVGVGLGSYGVRADQPDLVSSAHSTILTTSAELGVPGLLALLLAMAIPTVAGVAAARGCADPGTRCRLAALTAAYGALAVANLLYEVWADDFQWILLGALMSQAPPRAVPIVRPAALVPGQLRRAGGAQGGRADA